MELTIIYSIYNPSEELIQDHINNWSSYPEDIKKRINIILVDDFSDNPIQLNLDFKLNLTIARILEDKGWNNGGAKNLGFHLSKTKWSVHTDIDHFLSEDLVKYILDLDKITNTVYSFKRQRIKLDNSIEIRHSHINSYIIETELFLRLGGFDEDMSGAYGFEDELLKNQLDRIKINRVLLEQELIEKEKYKTPNINRDTSRNLKIWQEKLRTKNYKPGPMLRFKWKLIHKGDISSVSEEM